MPRRTLLNMTSHLLGMVCTVLLLISVALWGAHMVYLHNRGKAHMVYLQYRGKNLGSYESSSLGNGRCLFLTISIVLLEGFSSS